MAFVLLFISLFILCREQVDLEKRMKELKLDQLIPEEACTQSYAFAVYQYGVGLIMSQAGWPQMNAVHELATRMKKSVRDSGGKDWVPWVSVEMKRFLPDCFQEYLVTHFEVEDDKQPKANARRLELASWMAAWDG